MHNAESRKLSYKIANGVIMFIMILLMLITIYPLYYTICASFSDARALLRNNDLLLKPLEPFTLDGYKAVFSNPSIVKSFGNTVFYVVVGTAISMALTIAGAFVVSRSYFLPRNVMMKGMLFTMFFGGGLIPTYVVMQSYGLLNTVWSQILLGSMSTYNLILVMSYFRSIPESLEESAHLDGASDWVTLWKIYVPLSVPSLAVVALYFIVAKWNNWMTSAIYLTKRSLFSLQLILKEILISGNTEAAGMENSVSGGAADYQAYSEAVKYATIVVSTLPVLCVYPFLQKYFMKGIMLGAIKG